MTEVRVGDLLVTRVEESLAPGFEVRALFPDCTEEHVERYREWLVPNYMDAATNRMMVSMHTWVIRTGRHTILVDSCGGDHKKRPGLPRYHMRETGFLERLKAAGVDPESVDYVLCTHLHFDHIGWNTRLESGRWVPTFPNARYLMSRREHDFWHNRPANELGINAGAYENSILPVVESGQAVLTDGNYEIDERLLVEAAPGHTPGHVILKANSDGKRALFCGDAVHQPLQVYHPDWNTCFCELPKEARKTRRKILEFCSEHNSLLFPAHFGGRHFGRVRGAADRFAFTPGADP